MYPGKKILNLFRPEDNNAFTGRIHSTSDWPFSLITLSRKDDVIGRGKAEGNHLLIILSVITYIIKA